MTGTPRRWRIPASTSAIVRFRSSLSSEQGPAISTGGDQKPVIAQPSEAASAPSAGAEPAVLFRWRGSAAAAEVAKKGGGRRGPGGRPGWEWAAADQGVSGRFVHSN